MKDILIVGGGKIGTVVADLLACTIDYAVTVADRGHRDVMKLLLHDLRLGERRALLKDIFESAIPVTMQDVVLVFVTVSGRREGLLMQETFAHKLYAGEVGGRLRSAIQLTTASALCAVLDLLAAGRIPQRGFVRRRTSITATSSPTASAATS